MDQLSKNFSRDEFACECGCGFDTVDAGLITILQAVRDYFEAPVTVNSACRCETHNLFVGGGKKSQHLKGKAADIVVKGVSPDAVADYLDITFGSQIGLGRYDTFTHVDSRSAAARWDNRI